MCVWTDEEVGLLLQVTLKYKLSKQKEDQDWESCKYKYNDIWEKFHEALRNKESSDDFPRTRGETTKAQLTAKLKAIRGKFKKAVDSGRRTGCGKTVLIYYELCNRIWGGGDKSLIKGFPRTPVLDTGLESADFNIKKEDTSPSTSPSPSPPPCPERAPVSPSSDRAPASPSSHVWSRRRRLRLQKVQPQVNGHMRSITLKRTAPYDVAQEDLEIKRGMLELLKSRSQRADERMDRLVSSMETLVNVIKQSHAQLQAQCTCTCSTRPPQAGESDSSASSQGDQAAQPTVKLTDTFSLEVKTEPETTDIQ